MKLVLWLMADEITEEQAQILTKVLDDKEIRLMPSEIKWNTKIEDVQKQVVELEQKGVDVIISDKFPPQVWLAFIDYAEGGYWRGVSILAPIYGDDGRFLAFEGWGEHYHCNIDEME